MLAGDDRLGGELRDAVPYCQGRVGIVAASGTGAQEVMCLLDRWGAGISHVIGVGGRDLSIDVGGRMASLGLGALSDDEDTEVVVLISKPPAPEVARSLLGQGGRDKPVVAALLGLGRSVVEREEEPPLRDVSTCRSLEGAAVSAVPTPTSGTAWRARAPSWRRGTRGMRAPASISTSIAAWKVWPRGRRAELRTEDPAVSPESTIHRAG